MPPYDTGEPTLIIVLDTSTIIRIKHRLRPGEQWHVLQYLDELVAEGWVTFPKQVAKELEDAEHPDAPGVWCVAARANRRYREPSDDTMAEVLGQYPGLLDPNAERNYADPYVVVLAYELRERHPAREIMVATEDVKDRPPLMSLGTACDRLGLRRLSFMGLLHALPRRDPAAERLLDDIISRLEHEAARAATEAARIEAERDAADGA